MTQGRDGFPFNTSDYIACAEASGQICQLYRRLHRLSPIPVSLWDLHAVFVAGFTLIYCICTCPFIYTVKHAANVGARSTILYVIDKQWSSAKKYRDSPEVVAEKMMESTRKYHESSSAQTSHFLETHHSRDNPASTTRIRRPPNEESNIYSSGTNSRQEH